MAFKIGDFVRFIDEKREGYITQLIDQDTVGVTDTDGFEIPVNKNNLTYVNGHFSNKDSLNNAMPAVQVEENFVSDGIYLAVVADSKASVVAHFHLINRSSFQLLFSLCTQKEAKFKGEFAGIIQAHSAVQIFTVNLGELDQWPDFIFQILFFTTSNQPNKKPFELKKHFRSKDFSAAKTEIKELKKFAWIIRLDEPELVIDTQKLKESFFTKKEEKPMVKKPLIEVDLHIDKLREDYHFLSPNDILNIQLQIFEDDLAAALVHQMPEIIFIHGVGNGTLSHQIHKRLSQHPQVRTYMDAHKEKFGYGATRVILT